MMPAVRQQSGVSLHTLLEGLVDSPVLAAVAHLAVHGITQDSRQTEAGDMFIALSGMTSHGLQYAEQAVDAGATVVLWDAAGGNEKELIDALSDRALCLQVEDLQLKTSEIAARFYRHPSRELKLIGITGTDGKTSVSHYLAQCLHTAASPCGVLGTLGNGLVDALTPTGLTTASAVQVQKSLADLVEKGATWAAMEVSSHGLDQGRVSGVSFDTAVFTNLSQDHLDYHKTLDAYFEAKSKLFQMAGLRSAVINLDDEFGRILAHQYNKTLTVYGYSLLPDIEPLADYADQIVHTESIKPTRHGFEINVATPVGSGYVELPLLGRFNVANALAVLATLLVNHVSLKQALERLHSIRPVAGRMELIEAASGPTVIVDYAHTPQGLVAACQAARQHFTGELWCVFGCGGDRDRDKRPLMAQAAEQVADHVIVTSDNPRHEDPQAIIEQIVNGFARPAVVATSVERREAIAYAIAQAADEDVILLAGKGHETCQLVGDRCIDFDDRKVVRELLSAADTGAAG
jgi:UDP-N-acetylmuramoyl-L-alanyl-D-glutamate--2,6-diaminopimelate ligase